MAIDRAAAKAAGYTDAEIDAYEAEQKKKQPEPQIDVAGDTPPPPPPADANQGEASGTSLVEVGTTLATAAAPYAGGAALTGLGLYGASKIGGWGTNVLKGVNEAAGAYKEVAKSNAMTQEFRALERLARGSGPEAQAAQQRLTQMIKAQSGLPTSTTPPPAQAPGPVAPQATPAQAQAPAQQAGRSIVQTGMDYANRVRQAAMDRVIQPAGQMLSKAATYSNPTASAVAPVARAATGIGALVMPGNVGQNYPFPMSGPMKGREINPTTGAPWTPQELEAYRAQYGN
jgi:hypothetical protein